MNAITKSRPEAYKAWPKGLQHLDKPQPELRSSGDVLIKVLAGGICGTDVGIYQSKDSLKQNMASLAVPNVTIGHEFCGRIADAGPKAKLRLAVQLASKAKEFPALRKFVGKRTPAQLVRDKAFLAFVGERCIATAEMHIVCRTCAQCKLGQYHVCTNTVIRGLHGDGAFAEYVVLPSENVLLFANGEIPKIPLNIALLKGASIVGVFWGSFVRLEPEANAAAMRQMIGWMREGKLRPLISARYSLRQVPEALNALASRSAAGKLVVVPGL